MSEPTVSYIILLRTPIGRYVWWPALQIIEYYHKSSRRKAKEWHLSQSQNCATRALRKCAKLEYDRTFKAKSWQ